MTRHEFLQETYELSLQAGTNQRYHQSYADCYWRCDTVTKAATAIFAVVGAILAFVPTTPAPPATGSGVVFASQTLGIIGAITAVILNVIPFGSWEQIHRGLLGHWTDLRADVDDLELDLSVEPDKIHYEQLKKLKGKAHRLCGSEPNPSAKFVLTCYQAEKSSRQLVPAAA